uniref:Uncharacterized protein n=1 Tax=Rhizophora mucronata TaxID=61149 RepID=A0A2P2R463_RHIMU
MLPRTTTFQ